MSNIADVQPRVLKSLLLEIHQDDTRLPEFQRDFVWSVDAIKRLLGSLGNEYPIGSILRLNINNGQAPFGWRLFNPYNTTKKQVNTTFKYMVLDGQQRLTSLLHAFYGLGDYLFYIDFKNLHDQYNQIADHSDNTPDDINFEECIVTVKKTQIERPQYQYNQDSVQKTKWLMPIKYLSEGGFYQWLGRVEPTISQEDKNRFYELCENISNYQIPVVTLSENISISAICTIFETLNSSGKQLTPFELVSARIYGQSQSTVEMRKLVQNAQLQYTHIASKEFSDYALLQVLALLVTYNSRIDKQKANPTIDLRNLPVVSCKRKDVLAINVSDVNQYWDDIIEASDFAFQMLKASCGLIDLRYLPYKSILVPLIATIVQIRLHKKSGPTVAAIKVKLTEWYWNVVFSQHYETSTDTRGATDFVQLVDWIENNKPQPSTMHTDVIEQLSLREFDNPNSGIYKAVICLINQRQALDFYSGNSVNTLSEIDDHHVFPYAFLKQKFPRTDINDKQREQYYNCVLNRTLISRRTNIKIKDKMPSIYIAEIKNTHRKSVISTVLSSDNRTKFHDIFDSHLLPHEDDTCYLNDDYESFLSQRQDVIMLEIKKVTGLL